MATAKKTIKKEVNKPKTVSKKSTTKATVKEDNIISQEDIKKPIIKREIKENPIAKVSKKDLHEFKGKYVEAVGKRKTSIARVRFYLNDNGFTVNNKTLNEYFPIKELQDRITLPLELTNTFNKFAISIKVSGGGFHAQSDASVLGISRCLIKFDKEFRAVLKHNNLLTRDSRIVERKKYGLHKARRAPQWRKR